MDNPEKLATYGAQNEEKQNKITRKYVLETTIRQPKLSQNTNHVH